MWFGRIWMCRKNFIPRFVQKVMTSSVQFCQNKKISTHSNWTGPTDLRPPGNPLNGPKTVCRSHGTILRNELFFSFRTIYPSICRLSDVKPKTPKSKNRTRIFQHNLTPYLNSSDYSTSIGALKSRNKIFPLISDNFEFWVYNPIYYIWLCTKISKFNLIFG